MNPMGDGVNLEEELSQAAGELESEYANYDVIAARLVLEDLVIAAETAAKVYPHPAAQATQASQAAERPAHGSMWIVDWTERAACKGTDPDELFVQGAAQNRAKLICRGCPVRTECLADALDHRIEFGVWGGMTERERRALLRRRPDVTSWREVLERARKAYEKNTEVEQPELPERSAWSA
jgi:WhiB family redox-sensing transcriptional regulator